jgi:hypothetical protein
MPPIHVRLDTGEHDDPVHPAQSFSLSPWDGVYEAEIKSRSVWKYF